MPHVVKPTRSYKNRIHHPGSALQEGGFFLTGILGGR